MCLTPYNMMAVFHNCVCQLNKNDAGAGRKDAFVFLLFWYFSEVEPIKG